MSVLLEALKKASEEKKKLGRLASSERKDVIQLPDQSVLSNEAILLVNDKSTDSIAPLNFNFDVVDDGLVEASGSASSESVSEKDSGSENHDFSFNLTAELQLDNESVVEEGMVSDRSLLNDRLASNGLNLHDAKTPESEKSLNFDLSEDSESDSLNYSPESQVSKGFKPSQVKESAFLFKLMDEKSPEKPLKVVDLERSLAISDSQNPEPEQVLYEDSGQVTQSVGSNIHAGKSTEKGESVKGVSSKTPSMIIEEEQDSAIEHHEVLEKPEKPLHEDLEISDFPGSSEVSLITENAKEFDWSLDQIPGYQQYESVEIQQEKTKRFLSSFIQRASQAETKAWRLYAISVIVVLLGFSYYGLIYFDQQSARIDLSLKRYQLPSQAPNSLLSEAKRSNAAFTEKSKTPLNDATTVETSETQEASSIVKPLEHEALPLNPKVRLVAVKAKIQAAKKEKESAGNQVNELVAAKLTITSQMQESNEELGYQAYEKSNLVLAKQYYQKAFHQNSNSIPALFGLGAVATQQGDYGQALTFYKTILSIEPDNKLAKKAILSLEASGKPNIQAYKKLLDMKKDSPDDPEIAFALGNYFAKMHDWVNAQKEYFNAYQRNSENDNYAINLAVSLDQLGEYRLAKQYYEEALSKMSGKAVHYNVNQVKGRLAAINHFLAEGN